MLKYSYAARTKDGTVTNGELNAQNYSEFLIKLREQDLYCISHTVNEIEEEVVKSGTFRVKGKNLVLFTRQLSTMLSAGVSIVKAIDILHEKTGDGKLKESYKKIYESLQQGKALSNALQEQKGVYPNLLIQMIKSGEISGTLDDTLSKMAIHYESDNKLKSKVKSASIYPIVLVVVMIAVVVLLLAFVMPTFFTMFEGMELPLPTRMLVGLSEFITNNAIALIVGTLVVACCLPMILKQPQVKAKVDEFKLKMPMFGKLYKTIQSARFARTFATLYFSGVNIIEIMEICSDILDNDYLSTKFRNATQKISNGELISTSIANEECLDAMLTSMIFIGEESGMLDQILEKTADFYDQEADSATQQMVALMEPIIIVCLGVVVGFIIISIMLPLTQSFNNLQ